MGVVVRTIRRADRATVDALAGYGVATIHEAQGRAGLLDPRIRPIYRGAHISGTAVTVSVPPGDNWMIHVAVELCEAGDVVVVAPTSRSDAGYFGELLATALDARGVAGLVIDAGCRDVAELTQMGFPVWSRCISAQGTVKETIGDVNVSIVCAGQRVEPGDVIVADDDGVVVVPRRTAAEALDASRARDQKEAASRKRYEAGELSLDVQGMRERLAQKGLVYLDEPPEGEGERQRAGGRGSDSEGERQRAGGLGSDSEGERQRAGGRGSDSEGERQRAGGRGSDREGERQRAGGLGSDSASP